MHDGNWRARSQEHGEKETNPSLGPLALGLSRYARIDLLHRTSLAGSKNNTKPQNATKCKNNTKTNLTPTDLGILG